MCKIKCLVFQTGLTALHVAASYGQLDFIRELLITVPATLRSEPPGTGNTGIKDLVNEVNVLL